MHVERFHAPNERCELLMRYLLVTAIFSLLPAVVSAQSLIALHVNGEGEVAFVNNASSMPQSFSGYSLLCTDGCLDPSGWNSISSAFTADTASTTDGLGAGAGSFIEANPNNITISELAIIESAVLQPGASWSIGKPFAGTMAQIDAWLASGVLSARVSSDADVMPISIQVVPEPTSHLLFVGLSMLLVCFSRRRRS